jgi:hypothetical protein
MTLLRLAAVEVDVKVGVLAPLVGTAVATPANVVR